MSAALFAEMPEWQKLKRALIEQLELHHDACINAPDFPSKEYERGWYDALRSMLEAPALLLSDKEEKQEQNLDDKEAVEERTVSIVNRRHTGFFRG